MKTRNNLEGIREVKIIRKTELAKAAGISRLTIDRIERASPAAL
jgi:DNA-binding XRE family transcriptional regulator